MNEISLQLAVGILIFINVLFWVGVACGKRWERQDNEISMYKDES